MVELWLFLFQTFSHKQKEQKCRNLCAVPIKFRLFCPSSRPVAFLHKKEKENTRGKGAKKKNKEVKSQE